MEVQTPLMPDQSHPPHECRCEICKEVFGELNSENFKRKVKIVEYPSKTQVGASLLKASISLFAEWMVLKESKESNPAALEQAKGRLKEILWREYQRL